MLSFVKLGGSLITDKRHEKRARPEVIVRLAHEIAELRRESSKEALWIVGHGSGSFGHVEAHRSSIHEGLTSPDQRVGLAATADEAARLHRQVVGALREAGETPFSLAPSSFLLASEGHVAELYSEPLRLALAAGLLPVVYGDVVMDRAQGCAICSTEDLFVALAEALGYAHDVARIYWLGETDGVYDADGETIREISAGDDATELLADIEGASGVDVTGGMRHRLSTTLELASDGVSSWIGNGLEPGLLGRAVRGEAVPGTWIRP